MTHELPRVDDAEVAAASRRRNLAVAVENLHHAVFARELDLLETLALDLLVGVEETFVIQLRELLLELHVFVVQAFQFRVSVDERDDELLVPGLHSETPFDHGRKTDPRMLREPERGGKYGKSLQFGF